jgi:hypothetical protein
MAFIRLLGLWFKPPQVPPDPNYVRCLHRLLLWQLTIFVICMSFAAIAVYLQSRGMAFTLMGVGIGWFAVVRYDVWRYMG